MAHTLLLLQDSSAAVRDEESSVHRALLKYLDAWFVSPDSWEYNLHAGRLLLLHGRSSEALQHLQSGLALRPLHPALRSAHTVGAQLVVEAGIIIARFSRDNRSCNYLKATRCHQQTKIMEIQPTERTN